MQHNEKTMISKILETYLKDQILKIIWLIIVGIISSDWLFSWSDKTLQLFPELEKPILGKAIIIMFFLSVGLLISLIVVRRKFISKPNLNDYEIINPPGFMKHKATGGYFCQPCLLLRHVVSELSTIDTKKMLCRSCKETYEIDYSVLICNPYLSMVHDKAANELIHKGKEN